MVKSGFFGVFFFTNFGIFPIPTNVKKWIFVFFDKKLETWKLVEINIPSFIGNHEGFNWLLSGVIMK